jgi:hypothetical protein
VIKANPPIRVVGLDYRLVPQCPDSTPSVPLTFYTVSEILVLVFLNPRSTEIHSQVSRPSDIKLQIMNHLKYGPP